MLKIKIDYKSFFEKGVKSVNDDFFIRLITGYQGTGKSYLACKFAIEKEYKRKIKTNIKSFHYDGITVEYFEKIDEIIFDDEDNVTYIIDEVSKKYTKDSRQDKSFYSWLQQSRKHKRHVYLITQEYIQVPIWLRGIANTVYTTKKLPIIPIYITSLGVPVLSEDTFEWSIVEYLVLFYKRTKVIADSYNTFESVPTL